LAFSIYQPALAAENTITWTGEAGDGLWHTAGNWDLERVPEEGDYVIISDSSVVEVNGNTAPVTLDCSGQISVASGGHLYLTGTSYLRTLDNDSFDKLIGDGNITIMGEGSELQCGGGIIGDGTFTIGSGAKLVIDEDATGFGVEMDWYLVNNGKLMLKSGDLYLFGGSEGEGTLTISEGAYLSFGDGAYNVGGDVLNGGVVYISVLYLDDNKNVVALLTTNGEFYRYEQNTSFTPGNDDDQEIYTSYRSQGSDSNLDLIAEISAGSQTMLHEVMTGLYMSVPGEGSEAGPMNSFYAKADYFGFDNEGNLVLLEKSIDTFEIEDDKYGFNGAKVLIIKNAQGNVLLRILELRDNRIVFLFEDNTWFDSNDDTGFIPRAVDRSLAEYSGNSQIHLNGVQAGTVNISYAGEHTILTDNGGDNTNIIADNITIASQGNGNVFSAENPLVIRPYTTDAANVKLKLVKADAGEAFNASAYIVASGAGGKVDLHDTQIGSSGLLDLLVSAGAAELNNVGIHVGGNMKLSVNSGDVTMKQVEVEGSMTAKTDAGNININELDVSGTLGIETGGGDISMKDVDVSGSMTSMSSAGAIGIDSLNIGGNGTLDMQTGNGNITMDKVDAAGILKIASGQGDVTVAQVNSDGTLQITAANGSLLMKDEDSILTIGPNSTAGIGDTWLDIGGDIGTAQLPFKLNILLDKTGNAQPLNIKNVVNIYEQSISHLAGVAFVYHLSVR
jgi:hypothetical protein